MSSTWPYMLILGNQMSLISYFKYTEFRRFNIQSFILGNPFNVMQAGNGIIAASSDQLAKEVTKLIIDTDLQTQRKRLKRT